MSGSQWHKFYSSTVAAAPELLFELLSDLPNYGRWLPASGQFGQATDVEPYPVQLGSRYHDGKPGEPGKDWWGTVTGFQPPGSIDIHHTISAAQLRATVDVHVHYSLEPGDNATGGGPAVRRGTRGRVIGPSPRVGLQPDGRDRRHDRLEDSRVRPQSFRGTPQQVDVHHSASAGTDPQVQ